MERLSEMFFHRPCLTVAPELVGKLIVCRSDGEEHILRITETEAYCGEDDTACHAHRGRTLRTEVLYGRAPHTFICATAFTGSSMWSPARRVGLKPCSSAHVPERMAPGSSPAVSG